MKEFYSKLLDNLHDGVYFVDLDRTITYWSRGAEMLTGYTASELVGRHCWDDLMKHVDAQGNQLCLAGCPLQKTISGGGECRTEIYLRHRDGHRLPVSIRVLPVFDRKKTLRGAVEVFTDHTDKAELLARLAELQRDALLDPLTGLANRRFALETIGNTLNMLNRYGWCFGLILIDIDGFKIVNDTYGHDIGDKVLRIVGRTLVDNSRSFDLVARWGGDEFVAVILNVDQEKLYRVADKLRNLVANSTLPVGNQRIGVTVSMGAALPKQKDSPDSLVKRADRLMYQSKSEGRNRISIKAER